MGNRGAFKIIRFGWAHDPGPVLVESRAGGIYLETRPDVDEHMLAYQHLTALALAPEASVEMLGDLAEEYARA